MKNLDDIRRQLSVGEFEFSRHAFKRAIERNISNAEIQQAGSQARIIENYPDDKVCSQQACCSDSLRPVVRCIFRPPMSNPTS
jgi:hypothetical protein